MDKQSDFNTFEKLFWKLSREMSYVWREIYAETFPGSQSHILFLLERNGPKKMSELAESLHLTAGAVTTASDRLNDQGYLTRIRDEKDRRVVRLELTEQGKITLKELQNKGRDTMKSIFKDIPSEDLQRMILIFEEAVTNIDRIGKDNDK